MHHSFPHLQAHLTILMLRLYNPSDIAKAQRIMGAMRLPTNGISGAVYSRVGNPRPCNLKKIFLCLKVGEMEDFLNVGFPSHYFKARNLSLFPRAFSANCGVSFFKILSISKQLLFIYTGLVLITFRWTYYLYTSEKIIKEKLLLTEPPPLKVPLGIRTGM